MTAEAISFILIGGSTNNRDRRNVNFSTLANFTAGETWINLIEADNVRIPRDLGFTSVWFHNYAGTAGNVDPPNPYGTGVAPLDKNQARVARYNRLANSGVNQLWSPMLFEQAIQAKVEDFALFGLTETSGLLNGFIPAMEALASSGIRIYTYQGRPAGDRKAADSYFPGYDEGSRYFDLHYLQSGLMDVLSSPVGCIGLDTTASDESPNDGTHHPADPYPLPYGDISYNLFRMIRNSGTYTYGSGYSNTFTNPSGREVLFEATPARGPYKDWVTGYSYVANYWLFDRTINGDPNYYQASEYAYTPVVLCVQKEVARDINDPSGQYLDQLDLWFLASGYISSGFRAAVKAKLMDSLGIDAAALPIIANITNNMMTQSASGSDVLAISFSDFAVINPVSLYGDTEQANLGGLFDETDDIHGQLGLFSVYLRGSV